MPTPQEIEGYIRQAAAARGIDPDIAIRAANTEGGVREPARRGTFPTGSSWWPFQLHYGGRGTPYEYLGTTAGMGNSFTAQTGWQPGDPDAWKASVDYALDGIARNGWGAFYGPQSIGITGRTGIGPNARALGVDPANLPGGGGGGGGVKVMARPLEEQAAPEVNPKEIVSIKDEPAKIGNVTLTSRGTRTIILRDGTKYVYEYGAKLPDETPASLEGKDFDPGDFAGLRHLQTTVDPTQQRAYATQTKPSTRETSAGWHWVKQADGTRLAFYADGTPVLDQATNEQVVDIPATARGGTETSAQRTQREAAADASAARAALARAQTAQVGQPRPLDPITAQLREAQTQAANVNALVAAQKLIPAQQKAISDAATTLDYIQRELAANRLTLDEANQYSEAVQQYTASALRGSTPQKDFEDQQKIITERAQIGRDLLNKRLETTATLTGNLYKDYQDLLVQGKAMSGESTYNPLVYAKALTDELGGGQEMSDLARALLAAATPGNQQPHPALVQPSAGPAVMEQPQAPMDEQPVDEMPEEPGLDEEEVA